MSIEIKEAIKIRMELIHPNEWNPNEQSDETFNQLAEEIKQDGFDHPINVVFCDCDLIEEDHYKIIGGEHRWRIMNAEGEEKILAVVNDDWDEKEQKLKTVRRNLLTGDINAKKFTALVNSLEDTIDIDQMPHLFGFDDEKEFEKYLIKDSDPKEKSFLDGLIEETKKEKFVVDSITDIVSTLFSETVDSVDQNYLCFTYKGSIVIAILCDNKLMASIKDMTGYLKSTGTTATDFMLKAIDNELRE